MDILWFSYGNFQFHTVSPLDFFSPMNYPSGWVNPRFLSTGPWLPVREVLVRLPEVNVVFL